MKDIISFFRNLETLIPTLFAIVFGVLSGVQQLRNRTRKLNKKQSTQAQLEELHRNYEQLRAINEKMYREFRQYLDEFKEMREAYYHNNFVINLKNQIKNTTYDLKRAYNINDSEFDSMLMDGSIKFGFLLEEIMLNGLDYYDNNIIKDRAVMLLKTTKANYPNISDHVKQRIRNEVAYPLLNDLLAKLSGIRKGYINGERKQRLKDASITFTHNFVTQSIKVYKDAN